MNHGESHGAREGDDGEENHHDTEQALHQIRGFDDVRAHAFQAGEVAGGSWNMLWE